MVGRQPFTDEVVDAGGRNLAAAQRVNQRVGVVQLGPGGVEEDDPVAHGRELAGADQAGGVGGDRGVQGHDVSLGKQVIKAVPSFVVVRVIRDDR